MQARAGRGSHRPSTGEAWERASAFDRRRPQVADTLAALLLAAVTAPWLVQHGRADASGLVFDAALLLPLVWRRRYPLGVFLVLAAVAFAQWLADVSLVTDVALLAALFTVASERPRREAVLAWGVLEVGTIMASVRWTFNGSWVRSLVGLSSLGAVAVLSGLAVRSRRAHVDELRERAMRLQLERDQQAQISAAAERARIAREMHDVIAHSLAVMITMADGAAAKLRRDPERAEAAIESVADVGRQALGETRRLLGVLRDPDGGTDLAPQPGLDRLGALVEHLRETGLDAVLRVDGVPFTVAPSAELAVYRIVQEATTNTLKHAAGARSVRVELRFDRPRLSVEVVDDGSRATGNADHGGHGLEGMRERVALYGGTLDAGPDSQGGWAVRATLEASSGARGAPPVAQSR